MLKIWNEDKWVKNWCGIDPKIGGIDLTPYFYFSRDSLNNKSFISTKKLSNNANKIFEQLISGSDVARNSAIKDAIEVSDYEAAEILQMIFTKLLSKTNIDINILKSYLEWGKTKEELYSHILNDLDSLPGSKLTLPMVPLITDFVKNTNQLILFSDIKNRWAKENPAIVSAIDRAIAKGGK